MVSRVASQHGVLALHRLLFCLPELGMQLMQPLVHPLLQAGGGIPDLQKQGLSSTEAHAHAASSRGQQYLPHSKALVPFTQTDEARPACMVVMAQFRYAQVTEDVYHGWVEH